MIARRAPTSFPEAIATPRLHGLARLALVRMDAGHDRLEAVMAALVAAVNAPGLPSCYDHLSPLQREIVLALWGNGATRLVAVSRALPGRRRTVIWRVAMDLCRDGVLVRVSKGVYRINPNPPALRPRPGCQALDVSLRRALAEGPTQIRRLAHRFGITAGTMHRRLAPLLASGAARRVTDGVYELAEGVRP